jgi:hypothetical protein
MGDWIVVGRGASNHAEVQAALAEQNAEPGRNGTRSTNRQRAVAAGIDVARWRGAGCWYVPVDGVTEDELRADRAIVAYAEYVPLVSPRSPPAASVQTRRSRRRGVV